MTGGTTAPDLSHEVIHMMGIGGAGVSAVALLAHAWGATVSGCDPAASAYGTRVASAGIDVAVGHDAEHLPADCTRLVVTSAVPADHPERLAARERGIPIQLRGEFLGWLTQQRRTLVIAGAHGKSTTTAMAWHVARAAGIDASCALGAELSTMELRNAHVGASDWLIVEGDESDRTLAALHADVAVVTNIERDHHTTYASDEELEALFRSWIDSLPATATVIAGPGSAVDRVVDGVAQEVLRFGTDEGLARDLGALLGMPGIHNARNAEAAVLAATALGADAGAARAALVDFPGIGRRFERIGTAAGVRVIDDYAHHPTEVAATLAAAREVAGSGQVHVIFQPHLYSRTQELADEFHTALGGADHVWVLPIYGAREDPVPGIGAELIAKDSFRLLDAAPPHARGEDLAAVLDACNPGDLLLTMGAGSVTALAPVALAALGGASQRPESAHGFELEEHVGLARFTTIGTGGAARWFTRVDTAAALAAALAWAAGEGLPVAVLGLGSNSLVADEGFDGLAVRLVGELAAIELDEAAGEVRCGGGASLAAVVRRCRDVGLAGVEFGCAIPGTVGGAVRMNAGAYGGEMQDVLRSATVVSPTGIRNVVPADLHMRYRHTNLQADDIVAAATLRVVQDDPAAVTARVKDMQGRRRDSQPRGARTFGSAFQNPSVAPPGEETVLGAGALIERAGLKGYELGGARISPKHGNFIENTGEATTADVIQLLMHARAQVRERFGVELQTEVHLLGHNGFRLLMDREGVTG